MGAGSMSTFVLVHGSWHGAWCWTKLVPLLEAAGHRAVALDLPGHGDDATPIAEITLDGYAKRIVEVVAAQSEPVVLVGHSMGGAAISQAAEQCTSEVALLVFLAAFVPADGASVVEQALLDPGSKLNGAVDLDAQAGVAVLDDAIIDECFYADCSAEDIAFARARLRDDPLAPLATPVSLSAEGGRVPPRVYIECANDVTLTVEHQRTVRAWADWAEVYRLDTSHSPFFSAPDRLAEHLLASVAFAR